LYQPETLQHIISLSWTVVTAKGKQQGGKPFNLKGRKEGPQGRHGRNPELADTMI
jgi:hypothetical protein